MHFNPRSRVGNDRGTCSSNHADLVISIHVPAWGTTQLRMHGHVIDTFQSTFPRGERQALTGILSQQCAISIHVPAWGTTRLKTELKGIEGISIHVPAWGTTMDCNVCIPA